jgi:hypothetical protein
MLSSSDLNAAHFHIARITRKTSLCLGACCAQLRRSKACNQLAHLYNYRGNSCFLHREHEADQQNISADIQIIPCANFTFA